MRWFLGAAHEREDEGEKDESAALHPPKNDHPSSRFREAIEGLVTFFPGSRSRTGQIPYPKRSHRASGRRHKAALPEIGAQHSNLTERILTSQSPLHPHAQIFTTHKDITHKCPVSGLLGPLKLPGASIFSFTKAQEIQEHGGRNRVGIRWRTAAGEMAGKNVRARFSNGGDPDDIGSEFTVVFNMPDRPSLPLQTSFGRSRRFPTTDWQALTRIQRQGIDASKLTEKIFSAYWHPIYGYIRAQGFSKQDAEDLTQEFLTKTARHDLLSKPRCERGRFRSYLARCISHFIIDVQRRNDAEKRGGAVQHAVFDPDLPAACESRTPADIFHRQWIEQVLDRSMKALATEWKRRGRGQYFEALEPSIPWNSEIRSQQTIATRLGKSVSFVRKEIFRLRQAYRCYLRQTVEQLVPEDDVEAELEAIKQSTLFH